jgi:hypothetical protein
MDAVEYPIINGIYKHYKGGTYQVISLATHTANDEKLVIYKSLEFGSVYARPLDEWFNDVLLDDNFKYSEDRVKRFTLHEGV